MDYIQGYCYWQQIEMGRMVLFLQGLVTLTLTLITFDLDDLLPWWHWWPLTLMTLRTLDPDMTSSITWWITSLMMSKSKVIKIKVIRVKGHQGQMSSRSRSQDWTLQEKDHSPHLWTQIWRHRSHDGSRDWWCHGQVTLISSQEWPVRMVKWPWSVVKSDLLEWSSDL